MAGDGYFIALTFDDIPEAATNAKVGLVPSSSGMELQDLDSDLDAVFKITDKNNQKLRIVIYNNDKQTKYDYDLSGLTLVPAEV